MIINRLYAFVVAGGLLAGPALAQDGDRLNQAEQLLRGGRGAEAYELLLPQQFAQAGNPDFDYLFGLAALEAGRADLATLAFERVLAVSPNHGAARLDMGRAYFALGDMPRARREISLALALDPPPAARATAARYLAAIDARESRGATQAKAYVEGGFGTDSNVTQGPGSNTLFLPLFGVNFTLNAGNQKVRDNFSQFNAGAEVAHRVNDSLSVYGGVDAKWRNYGQVPNFDYGSSDWRGGLQWQEGQDSWRLGAGYNDYRLDHAQYRTVASLNGEWRRTVSEGRQWMLFGQYSQVRYSQEVQANNDVNQAAVGIGWLARLDAAMPAVLSLSAFGGRESEADTARPRVDGDKDFFGGRIGGQVTPRGDLDLYASAGLQVGRYQRSNILYTQQRNDWQYDLAAGAVWRFAPAWSLRPQASWLRNDSNLSVNDYQRYEISVFLRRDFQ